MKALPKTKPSPQIADTTSPEVDLQASLRHLLALWG
jgi:hypothetical protein